MMRLAKAFATASMLTLLAGCAVGTPAGPSTAAPQSRASFGGRAMGGEQPVIGATVTLYATAPNGVAGKVGTNGFYAGTATVLGTATTDANGVFLFTGAPVCSDPDQVYLVASGGNGGGNASNSSILEMVAVGNCDLLTPSLNVEINEVTTAAAAYALAGFLSIHGTTVNVTASATNYAGVLSGPLYVGTTARAAGLTHAFANANNLVSYLTGKPFATSPGGAAVVPVQLLNSLGNSLQACTNSNGGTPALAFSTPTMPTADVGATSTATEAGASDTFTGTLTLTLNATPTSVAISSGSSLSAVASDIESANPQLNATASGTVLTITGPAGASNTLAVGGLVSETNASNLCDKLFSYTVDGNGVVPANTLQASLNLARNPTANGNAANIYSLASAQTAFLPNVASPGPKDWTLAIVYQGTNGLIYPYAGVLDANDNVYVINAASYQSYTATAGTSFFGLSSTGTSLYSPVTLFTAGATTGYGAIRGLAADALGNVWVENNASATGANTLKFNAATGTYTTQTAPPGGYTIAVDRANNLWIGTTSSSHSIFEYVAANAYASAGGSTQPLTNPIIDASITVDPAQNIWTVDYSSTAGTTNTVSILPNTNAATPAGTPSYTFATSSLVTGNLTGISAYGVSFDSSNNAYATTSAGTIGTTVGLNPIAPVFTNGVLTSLTVGTAVTGATAVPSTQFDNPRFPATDGVGNIFVPDLSSGSATSGHLPLARYSPSTGKVLGMFPCLPLSTNLCAANGATNPALYLTRFILIDSSGTMWVGSTGNNSLAQVFGVATPSWPLLSFGHPGVMP